MRCRLRRRVDSYERSDLPPLSGCVNDVALVRQTLKNVLGIPNEDIRVVVDERATKASILHRLRATLDEADEGDVVVYFFGHGSQMRDRDGDELGDRLDELMRRLRPFVREAGSASLRAGGRTGARVWRTSA